MADQRRTIPVGRHAASRTDCPLAPPQHSTVQARALHKACLIVGGIHQLSARLEAPKENLERWMRGEGEPPQVVFYAALEIILLYVDKATGRPS